MARTVTGTSHPPKEDAMINTATDYPLQNQKEAADWLGMSMYELRRLRMEGGGPRYVTLPNGEIKYMVEALHAWAFGEPETDSSVLHVYAGGSKVIPFPGSGVKVRKHLPPDDRPRFQRRRSLSRRDLGDAS